jgi:pyridoxamine 5'-phosphate oxidase
VNTLTPSDFTEAGQPFDLFQQWFAEAREKEVNDPDAMTLATVDADGLPDARMVLLKALEPRGFTFYTNSESAKGLELGGSMKAALVFHWKSLRRQVRVRGPVEMVTAAEADAYFASRPRDSRIGAWASKQSRPLESRFALEKAVAREAARFGLGEVPRPAYWNGYRVTPVQIEFWQDRPFRLHDRVTFRRDAPEGDWRKDRLYP